MTNRCATEIIFNCINEQRYDKHLRKRNNRLLKGKIDYLLSVCKREKRYPK